MTSTASGPQAMIVQGRVRTARPPKSKSGTTKAQSKKKQKTSALAAPESANTSISIVVSPSISKDTVTTTIVRHVEECDFSGTVTIPQIQKPSACEVRLSPESQVCDADEMPSQLSRQEFTNPEATEKETSAFVAEESVAEQSACVMESRPSETGDFWLDELESAGLQEYFAPLEVATANHDDVITADLPPVRINSEVPRGLVSDVVHAQQMAPEAVSDVMHFPVDEPNTVSYEVVEFSSAPNSVSDSIPHQEVAAVQVADQLDDTLVSNIVSYAMPISPSNLVTAETEDLLNDFDQYWDHKDFPQPAEPEEVVVPSEPVVSSQQALLDKLETIGQFTSGISDGIADRFEQEFSETEKGQSDFRLGQLLVDLGLITQELMDDSVRLSVEISISLGRVLIMSGWITSKQLQWAVQIQALLRDCLITKAGAAQVAELMTCSGMTLQRALNCAGYPDALKGLEHRATRIGDLLVESELVSEEDFNTALDKSQTLGLPVGRFLLIAGLVAEPLLETVVNAQRFVREDKISRDEAISAIKNAAERQQHSRHIEAGLCANMPLKSMRIGELLILAGIISEAHLDHAVEFGFRCNLPVGQVLVELEIVTAYTLEVALTLQGLVTRGSLEPIDAAYAMIDVHHHGYSLTQALTKNRSQSGDRKTLNFEQFLSSLELISASEIEEAMETARRSPLFVSKALIFTGALSEEIAQIALSCHFYVKEAMLTAEEALLLFNLCHRAGISVDDGLKELGLTIRSQQVACK